jgi:hypothetical protein
VADDLVLPVPEVLSAVYLIPASLPAEAARERAKAAVSVRVSNHLRAAVGDMLGSRLVTFSAQPSTALPVLPADLQHYLGAAPDQIRAIAKAADFVVLRAINTPGWPPLHEWGARAGAGALAADLAVPLVDAFVPRVLSPDQAMAALPDASWRFRLSDWVLVFQSAGALGVWTTTKGLGRFGLPELQVRNVPPQLARPWVRVLSGLASRLLGLWLRRLPEGNQPAFVQIPAGIEISEADVARAYSASPRGGGSAIVRLAADAAADGRSGSFLTVLPPDDYPASPGEHLAAVCAALFGAAEPDLRWLAPNGAMEQAIRTARESLPGARARLIAGELPLEAQLMVKHQIAAAGGNEYVWAYVTSWPKPETVLGYSADDAVRDPQIRAGRPVAIDARTIIDWAIWTSDEGIIEGGWTNQVALNQAGQDPQQ